MEQVAILDMNPLVGLVVGASRYWWEWDERATTRDRLRPVAGPQDVVALPPERVSRLYPMGRGIPPNPLTFLVRRGVLDALGGFEAHIPGLYDDQGFLGKAYLWTPVHVSGACWIRYRRHVGAITLRTTGPFRPNGRAVAVEPGRPDRLGCGLVERLDR